MKYFFLGLFIIPFIFCGCSSVNQVDKETYNLLINYQEKIGKRCINYIENDETLSTRDKNTIKNYDRLFTRKLLEMKVIE